MFPLQSSMLLDFVLQVSCQMSMFEFQVFVSTYFIVQFLPRASKFAIAPFMLYSQLFICFFKSRQFSKRILIITLLLS